MRRMDYAGNLGELEQIFAATAVGQLGVVDDAGYARTVPVNFAWGDGAIYFRLVKNICGLTHVPTTVQPLD